MASNQQKWIFALASAMGLMMLAIMTAFIEEIIELFSPMIAASIFIITLLWITVLFRLQNK